MLILARCKDKGRENELGKIGELDYLTQKGLENGIAFIRDRFGWQEFTIEVRP